MKTYLYLFFISFVGFACSPNNNSNVKTLPQGDYFSQEADTVAQMFAEGIVSQQYQELNAVFSPDGKEFYYTLADPYRNFYVIMMYKRNADGGWEGPEVAPFSGQYADADPYITSDNKQLYFISKRPKTPESDPAKDFDIWMVNRIDNGWSEAIRLDTAINTPFNEFYVSATDDGSIFYSGQYKGGFGYGDIYEAKKVDGAYQITNLGEAVNSPTGEGDPYVSPDGNMLIFMGWGRADDLGGGDLYISFKKDGQWQKAKNLGPKINSSSFEYCPMMSPDGKYFFWTSYRSNSLDNPERYTYDQYINRLENTDNGLGNVYWIKAEVLEAFRE